MDPGAREGQGCVQHFHAHRVLLRLQGEESVRVRHFDVL